MSTTASSEKSPQVLTRDYWMKRGRINLANGLLGYQSLKAAMQRQATNEEAENRYVRRNFWQDKTAEDEEMGDTYLGDVTITQSSPARSGGGLLKGVALAGGIALGGTGVGAGLAAPYIIDAIAPDAPAQAAPVTPENDTDTQYDIGLGAPEGWSE